MRVAVVGGTGLVGRHVVEILERKGHQPVSVSRSTGVDVTTGVGLDDALRDVAAVIDVTNTRATQFFEFAQMVVSWTRHGDIAVVPPLLMRPVAVTDVADALADLAVGSPQGRASELAGPATADLVDMVRRVLAARGDAQQHEADLKPGVPQAGTVGRTFSDG